MSMLRVAASAACCVFALVSGQAVAAGDAQCWQPYELEAAKVRDLHVMLMLGTLKCQAAHPEIASKYDAFVQKKNGQLVSYNNILKARFMRVNGIADGQRAYEDFNTRLGNGHSGNAQPSNVCEITDSLLTLATNAGSDELPMLAQSFSESKLGIDEDCSQAAAPAVASVTMGTVGGTVGGTAGGTAGATAGANPHEAVNEAAATVEVAKTETTAAVPPQSAAAALEAAAAALQTAAASLKAQPAPSTADTADKPAELPTAKPAVVPVSSTTTTPTG